MVRWNVIIKCTLAAAVGTHSPLFFLSCARVESFYMRGAIVNKGVKVRDPFSIRTHKNVGKVNCLPGENRAGLVLKHEPQAHCSPNMQKKTIINIISSKESFFTIVPPLIPPLPCQPCEMPPPVHHVLLHCLSFATFCQVRLNYSL